MEWLNYMHYILYWVPQVLNLEHYQILTWKCVTYLLFTIINMKWFGLTPEKKIYPQDLIIL